MDRRYLDELNDRQHAAVITNSNKVLVMAGAGTGKTKVLTSRIRFLIEAGVPEDTIVAFTFTNKAANSMKWRLEKMLGRETHATLSTFHSYCFSYVMMNYDKLGFKESPMLIDDDDKSKLIKSILLNIEEDYSNIEFIKNISKVKNHADISKKLKVEEQLIFNKVFHEYQRLLLESNRLDFDDMIPLFIKLLEIDSDLREEILYGINYVLVDEFQDTNQIQYDLVKLLASHCGRIYVVGDEDQRVYSFRNSDISIFKDFKESADEIIVLNQNYRCSKQILQIANQLIDFNEDRIKKNLFSNIDYNIKVSYRQVSTVYEEAFSVVNIIKKLLSKGYKPKDIAIIYRNNNQAFPIEKELTNNKIPYQVYGGHPFFSYKEIKSIISVYSLLFNPHDLIAFDNIYNISGRIEALVFVQFKEYYKNTKKDIFESLMTFNNPTFVNMGFNLKAIQEHMQFASQEHIFNMILEYLGYNKYLKENAKQKEKYTRIMAFKDLITNVNKSDTLNFINELMLNNEPVNSSSDGTVSLLTVHRSKGLEFKVVFFIGVNEGIIPPLKITSEDLDEERRVCYVGITRAMERLFIFSSEIHYINGERKSFLPSSFLIESGLFGDVDITYYKDNWYNR